MESSKMKQRPLSPHLQIYKMSPTMMMSILHRLTGAALYFGTLILVWLLIATASGRGAYETVGAFLDHPIGRLILIGYSWALIHHALGGLRHLIWDTGALMEKQTSTRLAWATIIGSLALTALVWLAAAL